MKEILKQNLKGVNTATKLIKDDEDKLLDHQKLSNEDNFEYKKLAQRSIPEFSSSEEDLIIAQIFIPGVDNTCKPNFRSSFNSQINRKFDKSVNVTSINCGICRSTQNIKMFPCEHCICPKCLVFIGAIQFDKFIKTYQLNQDIYHDYRFQFKCTVNNCYKRICIPFEYLLNKVNEFLDINYEQFRYFDYFRNKSEWNLWISYIDLQ